MRFLPYLLIPGLGAVTPLLALPAVSMNHGADGWTAIAIAQSIAGLGLVVAELGWGIVGPQRVAAERDSLRLFILRQSLASQLGPSLFLATGSAVAAALMSRQFALESAFIAFGTVLQATNPTWYFVGLGQPGRALWVVCLPRLILVLAAAVLVSSGLGLMPYAIAVVLMAPASILALAVMYGRNGLPRVTDFRSSWKVLRSQGILTLGRGVSSAYTSLPAAIVAATRPELTAVFAANDRIARMGLSVLTGVPSRFQSWIGSATGSMHQNRVRLSIYFNFALGLISGVLFVVLSPIACALLFAGTVELGLGLRFIGGFLILSICFSRGLGLALVAFGRANAISYSILPAAGLALLTIGPASSAWGAEGAALAVAASEIVAVGVQLVFLFRRAP